MGKESFKSMLYLLGYGDENFSERYTVQISGTSALKFDYVAFSDKYLKDISTSCIALQQVEGEEEERKYVENTKYLAAPVLIIQKGNRIRIWKITSQVSTLLQDDDDNVIYLYFRKNRFEFMADNLINAKLGYRQMTLFEAAGLIDVSRKATCKILSEEFSSGFVAARNYLQERQTISKRDLNMITSITMHVLSAMVIYCKTCVNSEIPDILELLKQLSADYREYFDPQLMLKFGQRMLIVIYDHLNPSINYQSVDHELLGYFYESTLLQMDAKKAESIRKSFGIYYTPRVLSQEIANSIPFENIPLNSRRVLDGTCGSGSLLISACKRLEELADYELKGEDKYDYLTKMIAGYDLDKFASEVARLSFLLYSLPYGNRWNIVNRDLLKLNSLPGERPYIIMGNPPYKEKREDQERKQKAVGFLDKYLEWLQDDGYIGIILPESFLQNDSGECQRKRILDEFDIMELWNLPEGVFQNGCSTIVLIARKGKATEHALTKIKILTNQRDSIKKYFESQRWDFVFFEDIQKEWKRNTKFKMNFSPVDSVLNKINNSFKTLGEVADGGIGIMLPLDETSSSFQDGWIPYIPNARNFRKYVMSEEMRNSCRFINYNMSKEEADRVKREYAGLRLRFNFKGLYEAKNKILVKLSSPTGKIDCIRALIDDKCYFPGHSMYVLNTKESELPNIALCALINSKLINSYVRRECVKRTIPVEVIKNIPVPVFRRSQIVEIESIYSSIKCFITDAHRMSALERRIDSIIYEAFQLSEEEKALIEWQHNIYAGRKGGQAEKKTEQRKTDCLYVSGYVERLNFENLQCTVYLAEKGEMTLKIHAAMPGWFLREASEFSALLSDDVLYDIKPLAYSYLDEEELAIALSRDFLQ